MFRKSILSLFICVSLSGCIFVPAIDSFKKLGISRSDRVNLLGGRVREYFEAMSWQDGQRATALLVPEQRATLGVKIAKLARDEKMVDHAVESTDFDEGAQEATVVVLVRSYKIPYYTVNDRHERQIWKFNISDGWLMAERSIAPAA